MTFQFDASLEPTAEEWVRYARRLEREVALARDVGVVNGFHGLRAQIREAWARATLARDQERKDFAERDTVPKISLREAGDVPKDCS